MPIVSPDELLSRMESKIDKSSSRSGCWLWVASRNANGYGTTWDGQRVWLAHRLVYTLTVGPIPAGLHLLHKCDTPSCVNPAHLFVGTDKDNTDDMFSKGRGRKAIGAANNKTKLTEQQVREIRAAYDSAPKKWGMLSKLARQYGVWPSSIQRVVQDQNWKHV